jgi:hypothetical protein
MHDGQDRRPQQPAQRRRYFISGGGRGAGTRGDSQASITYEVASTAQTLAASV